MTPADIKTARQSAGLTQQAAADLIGVNLRTWQKWEYGERKMPEPVARLVSLLFPATEPQR